MSDAARLEKVDGVAVITLNRPHARNAVNAEMSAAVGAALEELEGDPELRAGIVTGEGPSFCAGADLKALAAGESITAPGHPEWGFAGLVEHAISKPLVAAVNGFALGGGTEILLACDLAVVSEGASLGFPEVQRGLFAAAGGLIRMPREVPVKVVMELALTGKAMPPREALRWGLVNRVAPADEVMSAAMELARAIAANAPLAVRSSKRLVHSATAAGADWDREVWILQQEELSRILTTNDAREGMEAFAERRPPSWTGS
jgi:crotonobetainyl-CoA hydratase